jgi:hypothetical protein
VAELPRARRRRRGGVADLQAEYALRSPGEYRIAARVTDVFGNDGIATVQVVVK